MTNSMEPVKNINEKKLLELGFEKNISTPEESGEPLGFYYYTYSIGERTVLITNANTDCPLYDTYEVEFFNMEDELGKYYDYLLVKKLIEILNSGQK